MDVLEQLQEELECANFNHDGSEKYQEQVVRYLEKQITDQLLK